LSSDSSKERERGKKHSLNRQTAKVEKKKIDEEGGNGGMKCKKSEPERGKVVISLGGGEEVQGNDVYQAVTGEKGERNLKSRL